ncbi:MAG: glycerophosphodiester phosphodiesterase family protein [Candidatus Poseidoniaceae archaeon]
MDGWSQPAENTHASLVEAMQCMDGVEFDLRLTADDQLVVHHDHTVSISAEMFDGVQNMLKNGWRFRRSWLLFV